MKRHLFEITKMARNEQLIELIYRVKEDGIESSRFIMRESFENWLIETNRLYVPIEVNGQKVDVYMTPKDYWKEIPLSIKLDDAAQYLVMIQNFNYNLFGSLQCQLS